MAIPHVRPDRDQLRRGARVTAALYHFGKKFRGVKQLRTRDCPGCGQRNSWAVSISAVDGRWLCHAHGCRGDMFDLVAGYAGLDVQREFPSVLVLTANINGLDSLSDQDVERLVAERRRQAEAETARYEPKRRAAVAAMPSVWDALNRSSSVGEEYLAGRGLAPAELRLRGDIVRYSDAGEPAVALRDLLTGHIVGVQYRKVYGGKCKHVSETGSVAVGSAIYGKLADLDPNGVDVAVLVEGLADTLAASLAWPGCAVFGAPGARHLVTIALQSRRVWSSVAAGC